MKAKEVTQSTRINQDLAREIKIFVAANGGSIKTVLEQGALWIMSKGSKEYLKFIQNR